MNDITSSTQDRLRDAARTVVDKAVDATAPAADWIDDKRRYVVDEHKKVAQYVSANPVKAIAMILAIGFVLGRVL